MPSANGTIGPKMDQSGGCGTRCTGRVPGSRMRAKIIRERAANAHFGKAYIMANPRNSANRT